MERIAEADHAGERVDALGREMGSNAPAHRLAADEETRGLAPSARGVHHLAKRLLQHRWTIRRRLLQPLVREIERDDVDAVSRDGPRHTGHERMVLTGASAMRKHKQRARSS